MQKEKEIFHNPIRAQLTTTATKPCTYFAKHDEYGNVFVKGPYVSMNKAQLQHIVQEFKSILFPHLKTVKSRILTLDVDTEFLDCQYGIRKLWKRTNKNDGYFLVCDSIIDEDPIPVKTTSSPYAWTIPTKVVSFHALESVKHVCYRKNVTDSIFMKDPDAALQFVVHVLAAWICGCGADLALSNFLIKGSDVYAVDLEAWAKFDWMLSSTRPCSPKTQAGSQFLHFCIKHWELLNPMMEIALKRLNKHGVKFFKANKLLSSDLVIMKERVTMLQTLDGLKDVLNMENARKRIKI